MHPCRMTETGVADEGAGHRRDQFAPLDRDHLAATVVRRLADAVAGPVGVPGDAAYEAARHTFNGLLDRRPALTVGCSTTADVRLAVGAAADAGLPVAVRGGGHSVAGHGVGDGALVVDLAQMRSVEVDAEAGIARVGGGALWEDVDPATQAAGLAVPGGTYGDTGVGGLTLGGTGVAARHPRLDLRQPASR